MSLVLARFFVDQVPAQGSSLAHCLLWLPEDNLALQERGSPAPLEPDMLDIPDQRTMLGHGRYSRDGKPVGFCGIEGRSGSLKDAVSNWLGGSEFEGETTAGWLIRGAGRKW